ncbi:hemolysin family protein [Gloeocapsa sp. PCC 73106]|uniref:hemolysin family protein n=1 Tax=Gloeocapsa sp. PCC 73106 TaxID=102232 RepID=UPI0002AC1B56|nr:hemolysin family protein [Gloeocapsa sp. PCC 73106]ELR98013.1 CBS domain-containing protein [Gloeocapsa sp. PCC 73106]
MSKQDIVLRLFSVLLLIAINAFFVTAEFSIVSVRRSRITQLVEAGDVRAQTVQSLQRSIDRLLSTTQLGITLSSLALGWIGEGTMAVLVKAMIRQIPLSSLMQEAIAHGFAVPVAFLLTAYLQIVLGELFPKSVALLYSEEIARVLAAPSLAIARLFNPIIWILNQSTRFLLRLGGIKYTEQRSSHQVTPEELKLIINTARESTGLEVKDREILENIIEFREVQAIEVMVPRTQLKAIPGTATFKTLLNEVATTGHSRYPITGDSLDDIQGIIDFKDLALPLAEGKLTPESTLDPWIKPVRFVDESILLSELLKLMQRSSVKMVMLVDEFGGTSGLITLQDLIAEIIGDQRQRETDAESEVQIIDEQTFLVKAQMNLEDLNEFLGLDFPLTDEYQTLGGFVLYQWQKIPNQGETLKYDNLELTIVEASGPRLNLIQIRRYALGIDPEPRDDF